MLLLFSCPWPWIHLWSDDWILSQLLINFFFKYPIFKFICRYEKSLPHISFLSFSFLWRNRVVGSHLFSNPDLSGPPDPLPFAGLTSFYFLLISLNHLFCLPSSVQFAGLRSFALAGRLVPRKGYFCSEFALLERSINNLFLLIGFLSFLLAPHSCLLIFVFFWTFSHNISMELELLAAWLRVLWLCKEHICAQHSCKLWEIFLLNSIITYYCVLKVIGQDKMSLPLVEHIGIYRIFTSTWQLHLAIFLLIISCFLDVKNERSLFYFVHAAFGLLWWFVTFAFYPWDEKLFKNRKNKNQQKTNLKNSTEFIFCKCLRLFYSNLTILTLIFFKAYPHTVLWRGILCFCGGDAGVHPGPLMH